MSAAIALFAVTAFAQSDDAKNKSGQKREFAKNKDAKDKSDKDKIDNSQYDINNDGIFSPEEREARKAEKMALKETRRADRDDDGLLNGSTRKDNHGADVSGTARGTTLEGREKGRVISDVARSNGKSPERMQGDRMDRPDKTNRPSGAPNKGVRPAGATKPQGAAKPHGAGKPAGAGRKIK